MQRTYHMVHSHKPYLHSAFMFSNSVLKLTYCKPTQPYKPETGALSQSSGVAHPWPIRAPWKQLQCSMQPAYNGCSYPEDVPTSPNFVRRAEEHRCLRPLSVGPRIGYQFKKTGNAFSHICYRPWGLFNNRYVLMTRRSFPAKDGSLTTFTYIKVPWGNPTA